jgi:hypothetical protein
MKTKLLPSTAWAIVDTLDNTVMEQSGTGQLNIFYARVDAEAALPAVKAGSDTPTAKRLAIVEVRLAEVKGR